ncbi:MAG TPA: tetratricopeptide repeat protein, partial [Nitrospinota bacterium]|nr:tetratricopeptide repeat protein [Nitrospinota bacterium]
REFQFVLGRRPKDAVVRRYVAAVYEELNQLTRAEEELKKILEQDSKALEAFIQLARLYGKKKDWKSVYSVLDRATNKNAKSDRLAFIRGVFLARQKRYKEAIPHYKSAIRLNPKQMNYRFNLAVAFYETHQWKDVEAAIRAVLKVQPKHANALNLLGFMFSELDRDIDEAEQLLSRALAIDPNNGAFLDSMGWVYYRQGRYTLALKKIHHAINQIPDDAVILDHLADVYKAMNNIPKALFYWKKSYKIDPKNKKVFEKIIKNGGSIEAPPKNL